MSMFCTSQRVFFFFFFLFVSRATRSSKENSSGTRGRARLQVGGGLRLFVRPCYRLLFPVKTGKGEKKKGEGLRAWKNAALMCVGLRSSSVRPSTLRPTDGDPPGQEKQTY